MFIEKYSKPINIKNTIKNYKLTILLYLFVCN